MTKEELTRWLLEAGQEKIERDRGNGGVYNLELVDDVIGVETEGGDDFFVEVKSA